MTRPLEPAGGSRFPWKSLKDRIWMSMRGAVGRFRGTARGGDPREGTGAHSDAAEQAGPQAPW